MSTPSVLGPYPVERELGRGGMGVVYLGRDPKLNRPVAIKVLPEVLANTESLARFDREAKLLASLNHPNIATIYGVEEAQGRRLLVLEYIPGETLAVRTARGPLPIGEALDVCRQIALAIEAAHEGGVIHRDLKPGNVKITPDGQVKVLDFGLAKGATVSDAELAHSPTMTFAATGQGVILGTAGYMSPEQARGKAVDRRTDIWSFGCVLFECLTGNRLFEGETVSDTIARILERDPDWSALPPNTPPGVREVLRRCLEKDLKKRQRDIGDVRIQLEEAIAERASASRASASLTPPPSPPRSMSWSKSLGTGALLLVVGAAAGIGVWNALGAGQTNSAAGVSGTVRASFAVPPTLRAIGANITPDGQFLVVAASRRNPDGSDDPVRRLYTRRTDDYQFTPLTGTDRVQGGTISQDGKWLAIVTPVSDQSTQRQLVRVPIDNSSPPVKIANFPDNLRSLVWLENGDFLFTLANGTGYVRLPRGSETPGPEISFDFGSSSAAGSFGKPLPNGRGVLVNMSVYNTRGWSTEGWVLDLASNKAHRLVENAGYLAYSPTGHLVFSRGDTLMAAPFDQGSLKVTGDVTALSRDLRISAAWEHGEFSLARNGTLVFAPGGLVGHDRRLVSVTEAGVVTPFGSERRTFEQYPPVSNDGRRVAVVLANERGNYEIWTADQDHPAFRRTIAMPNADINVPVWSPDGKRIAFSRTALDKDDGLYVQDAEGTGTPQLVLRADVPGMYCLPGTWTSDGNSLTVTKGLRGKSSIHLVTIPAVGGPAATARALRTTEATEINAALSPDGRFIAFESNESGRFQIYVAQWNKNAIVGRPLMVSGGGFETLNGGGAGIDWTSNSRRLYFGTPEQTVMSVTVDATPALTVSKPVLAYDMKKLRVVATGWNVLPDGRLFAIQRSEAEEDTSTFSVVFNWFDELRRRMSPTVK